MIAWPSPVFATEHTKPDDEPPSSIPSKLHRVVVEVAPTVITSGPICGNAFIGHENYVGAYRTLALGFATTAKGNHVGYGDVGLADSMGGNRRALLVLPSPPQVHEHDDPVRWAAWFADAKVEWLVRSVGGCENLAGYWI